MAGLTGYTIEMIMEPLIQLSQFIQDNLSPNRLEGFDLTALERVQAFEGGNQFKSKLSNDQEMHSQS